MTSQQEPFLLMSSILQYPTNTPPQYKAQCYANVMLKNHIWSMFCSLVFVLSHFKLCLSFEKWLEAYLMTP